jgi:hypothetical protein
MCTLLFVDELRKPAVFLETICRQAVSWIFLDSRNDKYAAGMRIIRGAAKAANKNR